MPKYYVMDLKHRYDAPTWEVNKITIEADTAAQAAGKAAALLLHRRSTSSDGLYEVVVSASPGGESGSRYTCRARVESKDEALTPCH